ncbi:PadR family transcriptional regulator [Cellulomonas fengjieae]|uniref:PadR family transcriptional regulator n=1 Tax=Cellulomonas fengjieae TaxID=2819978 RepID=UPI001AAE2AC5|nr:PadR family transcriptional regulator [Cellulomonas fengjieae]MBO3100561.1 helix-turn-helix transcriptional regulator [Cellulomonas fengjieae]
MTVPMALLALLDDGPSHGFALKRRYDAVLGHDRELRYGQVYSTLARLERDGLAEGVGLEQGDAGERKVYAITPRGVSELDEWLTVADVATGRPSELFAKVVLALVAGRPAQDVLDAQRAATLARMRELTAARHTVDAIDRVAADYEIAHLEADLHWVEIASARLADLAVDISATAGDR